MTTDALPSGSTLRKVALPCLLAIVLVFSVIEFIITAVLVHDYEPNDYPSDSIRDRLRFLLFTSCWSILFIPVFIFGNLKAAGQALSSVASNLGFIAITMILWLSGAASWTDALGGTLHCGDMYLASRIININIPYCHSLRAVQAFAWMIWITLSLALAYISSVAFRAHGQPSGLTGPMREASV